MKAMCVFETINFERGQDPKVSLGIGQYEKVYQDFLNSDVGDDYAVIVSEEDFDLDLEDEEDPNTILLDKCSRYLQNETKSYKDFVDDQGDEIDIRISPYGPIISVINEYQILTFLSFADKRDEIINKLRSYDK